mmetsp:Transcript_19728/g.54802  ORF Transcript_19728/g.54802 Transcript_19728/m.54802 type:complete len:82 (+) Transcript_19728:2312-2557(+)
MRHMSGGQNVQGGERSLPEPDHPSQAMMVYIWGILCHVHEDCHLRMLQGFQEVPQTIKLPCMGLYAHCKQWRCLAILSTFV